MTDRIHTEVQKPSSAGSKPRRLSASMFFKKGSKQESSSKDETIQRLQNENRKLRESLDDANLRIQELEAAAASKQPQDHGLSRSPSVPLATESHTHRFVEYRDDDGDDNDLDGDSDNLSDEAEAKPLESTKEQELINNEDIQSVTSSACTIPTGNDKRSKLLRQQQELRQQIRHSRSRRHGQEAYLNYFSRRNPPMERITEISTRRSFNDEYEDDMGSTTSDLTASVASSTVADDESISGSSLMSGKMLPLYAMKSLLRISSADSDVISFVPDDEPVLFGEI